MNIDDFNSPEFQLMLIRDMPGAEQVLVRETVGGEVVTRTIWALVERMGPMKPPGADRSVGASTEITVVNDAALGIPSGTYDARKTEAVLPMNLGGASTGRRLGGIVRQDPGMVTYALN